MLHFIFKTLQYANFICCLISISLIAVGCTHTSDLSMQRRYSSDEEAEQQIEQIGQDIQNEEAQIEEDNAAVRALDTQKINLGLQNQHIQNLRDELGKKFDEREVNAILKQMREDTQSERDLHNAGMPRCTIPVYCKTCYKNSDLPFRTFQNMVMKHYAITPSDAQLHHMALNWDEIRHNGYHGKEYVFPKCLECTSKGDMDKYMEEIEENRGRIEQYEAEIVAKNLAKQRSERFIESYRETGRVLNNTHTRKKDYRNQRDDLQRQIEAQAEAQRREKQKMATDMIHLGMSLDAVAQVMSLSVSELQALIADPRYHNDEDFVAVD